jgi:predicted GNAT family acetyltransferase
MADGHPLDRPVWNALTSRQAGLAIGNAKAVRIEPAYGLFAAAARRSFDCLAALGELIPAGLEVGTVEADPWPRIPGVDNQPPVAVTQMVAGDLTHVAAKDFEIVDLTDADGPEMLALATLTKPGPFFERTHRLGDFVGVKVDGRLAAMAGERLKLPGFTEVSAVCTHPDHRGHGYAAALMGVVASRIEARGEIPFLHVYPHNTGAIRIYEQLGYAVRREMKLTILKRD